MKNRLFWEDKSALDMPVSPNDDRSMVNLLPGTNNTLEAEDLADMLGILDALAPQDRKTALLLWAGFQPMEVFDGINAWVVAKRRMRRHLISRFPELSRN